MWGREPDYIFKISSIHRYKPQGSTSSTAVHFGLNQDKWKNYIVPKLFSLLLYYIIYSLTQHRTIANNVLWNPQQQEV
jgi:hypothetical protein